MARQAHDSAKTPQTTDGKTIIKAVVSHDRLLAEIEARNPIIAKRRKATAPTARPIASNR